jgi:hypothetical protein
MELNDVNIDEIHLAARCVTAEQTQTVLAELEAELAAATSRRAKILADISEANTASVRDQRAKLSLPALNREEIAAGRLIRSIERVLGEAKKRIAAIENQAKVRALKQAQSDAAAIPADKLFEVETPDGRRVRHRAASLEALRKILQPGYRAIGRVFGHAEDGTGGFVSVPGAPSMLKALLEAEGDELVAYLAARGIVGPPAQAPELAGQ